MVVSVHIDEFRSMPLELLTLFGASGCVNQRLYNTTLHITLTKLLERPPTVHVPAVAADRTARPGGMRWAGAGRRSQPACRSDGAEGRSSLAPAQRQPARDAVRGQTYPPRPTRAASGKPILGGTGGGGGWPRSYGWTGGEWSWASARGKLGRPVRLAKGLISVPYVL